MKSSAWKVIAALLFGQLIASNLIGQQEPYEPSSTKTEVKADDRTKADDGAKKVGFRLASWKTIHTHDQESVKSNVATLKKLGCEVATNNHGDHVDVRYRCVNWKSMELPSEQLAVQWTDWLSDKGLETVVVDPPTDTKKPTVSYRLVKPRTVHLHESDQAEKIMAALKLIGAKVSQNEHGDHIDATFSCPQWKTIELPTEKKAHEWQAWLKKSGFETRHTHVH